MAKISASLDNLLALLRANSATKLYAWRLYLVAAGALCGATQPDPAELLGHFTGQPLKLKKAIDGLNAITWTTKIIQQTQQNLSQGQLLNLAPAPPFGRAYALALADGIMGFADGLDFAGVDPDHFGPNGQTAFADLGRRAAALEILADELPPTIDDLEVQTELQALAQQSDADVVLLYRECHASGAKPL